MGGEEEAVLPRGHEPGVLATALEQTAERYDAAPEHLVAGATYLASSSNDYRPAARAFDVEREQLLNGAIHIYNEIAVVDGPAETFLPLLYRALIPDRERRDQAAAITETAERAGLPDSWAVEELIGAATVIADRATSPAAAAASLPADADVLRERAGELEDRILTHAERRERYTDTELLAFLQVVDRNTEGSLAREDVTAADPLPSASTYHRRFGSFNDAKERAGVDICQQYYDEEELLQGLKELDAATDGPVTKSDIEQVDGLPSPRVYHRRFESLNAAKEQAGIAIGEREYNDDELLRLLHQVDTATDGPVSWRDIAEHDRLPSPATYQRRFGSINAAKEAVGIATEEPQPRYDEAELLDMLEALDEATDGPVTQQDIDAADMPSESTYRRRFGSFLAAKQKAGIELHDPHPAYDTDELIELLRELDRATDSPVTVADVERADALPSPTTYYNRFGSLITAKQEAGLRMIELLRDFDRRTQSLTTQDAVNAADTLPSATTYRRYFGSFNAAKEQAGLDIQAREYDSEEMLEWLQELDRAMLGPVTWDDVQDADHLPSPATYVSHFGSLPAAKAEAGIRSSSRGPTVEDLAELFYDPDDDETTLEDVKERLKAETNRIDTDAREERPPTSHLSRARLGSASA